MRRILAGLGAIFAAFAFLVWTTDWMTLQGERTIYGARCNGGAWEGLHCTGNLVPGERYRFRSSRTRNEVVYWIAGSTSPSGKFSECRVQNRDNWACNATIGQPPTITHEMSHGRPAAMVPGLDIPFHGVTKWKWMVMSAGAAWFTDADFGRS